MTARARISLFVIFGLVGVSGAVAGGASAGTGRSDVTDPELSRWIEPFPTRELPFEVRELPEEESRLERWREERLLAEIDEPDLFHEFYPGGVFFAPGKALGDTGREEA